MTRAGNARKEYPIPVELNAVIVVLQLAAVGGIFLGASSATSWWQLALLALAFAIVGNAIYSIIHEAEHRILHPDPRINDLVGALMALLFPAPFHLLRQGHLGHHMRNRSDDEAFDFYFDGESRLWKAVQLYGALTGLYWASVVLSNLAVLVLPFLFKRRLFEFNLATAAFMDSLNPRYWLVIRLEAAAAIALHSLIVLGLGIPLLNYCIVYFGFGFSWSAMQYVHHFGTERHVLDGARDLRVWRWLDWIWLNHNWHRSHHRRPTVPWLYLPRLAREDEGRRPDFLLWHYLRMWRGPRYSDERVENKYAGRIID